MTFAHPYGPNTPELVEGYAEAVDVFNRMNPDVEVQLVPWPAGGASALESLLLAAVGGVAPDVVAGIGAYNAVGFYERGLVLDLKPIVENLPQWKPEDYVTPFIESFYWKGALVAFPGQTAQAANLFWNAIRFDEVGLDRNRPPASLQELLEIAPRFTQEGPDGSLVSAAFNLHFTWSTWFQVPQWFGAEIYDPVRDQVSVNTPEMRQLMEWAIDLFQRQGGYDRVTALRTFGASEAQVAKGNLAMIQHHTYVERRINSANPDLVLGEDLRVGAPLLWEGTEDAGVLAGTDFTAVMSSAPNPVEATRFALDMALGEASFHRAKRWTALTASIPISLRLLEVFDPTLQQLAKAQLVAFERLRPFPTFPEGDRFEQTASAELRAVLNGQKGVVAALEEIERTMNALISSRGQ